MKEGTRESGVPSLERTENEEQKMPDASFCRHLFLSIPDGRDAGTGCSHRQHPISGPLNTLLTIVTDLVTGIGSIITIYGIFEFGNAQQSQDGAAKSFAIQRISGGLIMVIAPQLLQLFVG